MRIGRTLPPAATKIDISAIVSAICGLFRGERESKRFRAELVEHFGVRHCFLVSSGKAALTLTLRAIHELRPDRDEVVIPAFTCYSVPASVLHAGLRIRLCDLDPITLDFDYEQLASIMSEVSTQKSDSISEFDMAISDNAMPVASISNLAAQKILAVIPTHLFGYSSDVQKIREIVQDPEIVIVEDAAQAMGEEHASRKLGTLGDVGFFSLGRGKAFTTVEGGVILTDRDDVAEVLERHIERLDPCSLWHQISLIAKAVAMMTFTNPRTFWIPRSLPFLALGETLFERHFSIQRMSQFQAGLTANWQVRLQRLREVRKVNAARWANFLDTHGNGGQYFRCFHLVGSIRFPIKVSDRTKRDALLEESARKGTGVMAVYPKSINQLEELGLESAVFEYPVAERYAREIVTLPTHEYLRPSDVESISLMLAKALDVRSDPIS